MKNLFDVEKSKITILKEPDTWCYGIKINKLQALEYYPSSYENPMFFKTLLKTMNYENKCNEIETYLEDQRYIEVQQEELKRQQEELKRRQENYQKQLQEQDDYCM